MTPDQTKIFTEFQYGAMTDLVKTYLTLEIGVLTLSVTFADRMFDFRKNSFYRKFVIVCIWVWLIAAILGALNSLDHLLIAASQARIGLDITDHLKGARNWYAESATLLALSLVSIVVMACIGLFKTDGPDDHK